MLRVAMRSTRNDESQTVHRMGQLYAALSQINQAIVRVATRDQLLNQICAALVEHGGFKMAWVAWNDPVTHTVSVASCYGDVDHYLDGIIVRSDDTIEGRGPAGTAIREGRLQVFNDFLGAPQTRPWHEAARRCGFQAIGAFPIRFGGDVCGAIVGYSDERDFFGAGEIELLVEAAADISFALDHLAGESRRRQAEEALRQSEYRLEEAQRIAHLGSWNWDFDARTLLWSAELCQIYGLDARTHSPSFDDFISRVHPDDRERVNALVGRALQDHRPLSFEFRILRPDGEIRTILDQSEVTVDASGQATGMTGACLDITRRKLEEQLEIDRGRILELVAQNLPLTDILSRIVAMLESQIKRSRCAIQLVDDSLLSTIVAPGLPEEFRRSLEGNRPDASKTVCGAASEVQDIRVCVDIANDPLWHGDRELAMAHGLRACWSVPVDSRQEGIL